MSELRITQRKSAIGEKEGARRTLVALGLRRTGQRVSHADTPVVRGMLRRVAHLVEVDESERAQALPGRGSPPALSMRRGSEANAAHQAQRAAPDAAKRSGPRREEREQPN